MKTVKKLVLSSMGFMLLLGGFVPTASAYLGDTDSTIEEAWDSDLPNENQLTGPKKTETIRISNSSLKEAGSSALAVERILLQAIPYTNVIGIGGAASYLAGAVNQGNGYELNITMQYGSREIFDGTHWVDYTGWHVLSQSISTY